MRLRTTIAAMRRACCSNIVSTPYDDVAAIALDWLHGVEWEVGAVAQHVGAGSAHSAGGLMGHFSALACWYRELAVCLISS